MRTYRGILKADQPDNPDGSYPIGWRGFAVVAEDLRIRVLAETGGVRDRLLAMEGKVVEVEAPPPPPNLRLTAADWHTVRVVEAD